MNYLGKRVLLSIMVVTAALALAVTANAGSVAPAREDVESIKLATDIFKQLIEINTTDSVGSTIVAAEAMAKHLSSAR